METMELKNYRRSKVDYAPISHFTNQLHNAASQRKKWSLRWEEQQLETVSLMASAL
jgi:hypothetical protein